MKTISNELRHRVYSRVRNQVAIQSPWEVWYPVEVGVWDQLKDRVRNQVEDQIRKQS